MVIKTKQQGNKITSPSFYRFRDKICFEEDGFPCSALLSLPKCFTWQCCKKNEIRKDQNSSKFATILKRKKLCTLALLISFLFALQAIFYPILNTELLMSQSHAGFYLPHEITGKRNVLSIVVITFNKPKPLRNLLRSLVQQRTTFNFEVLIADNGCLEETKNSIESVLNTADTVSFPWKQLKYCDNPGYGAGNNRALKHTQNSKWVLFLNDDVELEEDFLHHMVNLGQRKEHTENVGAVGCRILNIEGTVLLEAGSIIWNDGTCYGYGRGRTDIDSSDIMYTRPVDFVSGTCLMVLGEHIREYGGFDTAAFEAYYEDTDMQMRIKHVHKKTIWYQPLAVIRHEEHGSFGKKSLQLMQQGEKVFKLRWKDQLVNHVPYTDTFMGRMHASRGLMRFAENILYIDQWIPDPKLGSGFGRAYDNVKILSEFGYFVTLHAIHGRKDCDDKCMYNMQQDSVEIHRSLNLTSLLTQRPGFYSYVVVSRPPIWQLCMNEIKSYCRNNERKCKIIYDAEAFWFRRDELFLDAINNGYVSMESIPKKNDIAKNTKELQQWEENILFPADAVIAVSEDEAKHMRLVLKDKGANVHVVGHMMEIKKQSSFTFEDRLGILFIASFNAGMYYNGDAIFYFVKFVYPLVLESSAEPIPLVIAGRNVPNELKELVDDFNAKNKIKITIHDSPRDILPFYEKSRVFIAPHLYGSGIQYKLSEALSRGIPIVVSKMSAEKLALSPEESCIGDSKEEFATCVISVHNNATYWKSLQGKGLEHISRTHNRKLISSVWREVIYGLK